MEYTIYQNTICVPAGWLYEEADIISINNYRNLTRRNKLNVIRRGCKGTPALVEFDSIPKRFRSKVVEILGHPDSPSFNLIEKHIKPDEKAREFFENYLLQNGDHIPEDKQIEYRTNAEILQAIPLAFKERKAYRKKLNGRSGGIWDSIVNDVQALPERYVFTRKYFNNRLGEKLKKFQEQQYQSLIPRYYGNNNSRKVDVQLERLIISLYCQPHKPYAYDVYCDYLSFLAGDKHIVDVKSGEIFNPAEFHQNGKPITISEATVWNYINYPHNRALVDKHRNDTLYYKSTHEPHHHRHTPNYSFSKISMDDRDLLLKTHDKRKVFAYYSFDVKSGAVVGASYGRSKNNQLFIDCLRDMFRFCHKNQYGIPMEVEVENHIVRNFEDQLAELFPYVRWCNAGNSQEKYAERLIGAKKYSSEKKAVNGTGRHYAKLEANRNKREKIFDSENDNYKEKYYTFEEIVAIDQETIDAYNNALHPNQKQYNGMTRLQVLKFYLNTDLTPLKPYLLAKSVGEHTQTSIQRNQYCQVQYAKYQIPTLEVMEKLKPNNYNVDAYWLPSENGSIEDIYIYQGDKYLGRCEKIEEYNRAKSEWTEADELKYTDQTKIVTQHRAKIKRDKAEKYLKVEVFDVSKEEELHAEEYIPTIPNKNLQPEDLEHDNESVEDSALANL